MEIAFSIYFGVGIFWAALFLIINTMTFFIDDEFNPILARLFFGALVWPLIVLGGLIFVIVMGARAAWLVFLGLRGAWRAAEFDVPKIPKKKQGRNDF